jgi:uncharacterized membrane protein
MGAVPRMRTNSASRRGTRPRARPQARAAAGCTGAEAPPPPTLPARLARQWRAVSTALSTPAGQRRAAWLLTALAITLELLILGRHVLQRHFGYHSEAFDLGNMDQAVWNTLHGQLLRFTNRGIDWYGPPTRLAEHVEPMLILIAPLYLVHSGADTLLALQTLALVLGAIPLLALAQRRLPDAPLLGLCFVLAYLLAPELLGEALYDFHPVALATPLLLAAFWALDARRYGWLVLAGVLAAACKEDVALALVPLGAYIALRRERPRLGWGLALGALAWTALCFFVIIPHFNDGTSDSSNAFWYRYAALGQTPKSAVRNLVTDPLRLLGVVFTPDKLGYLGRLALAGGALGLFAPLVWLVGLPELAINLLSDNQAQYSGFYQYNAMLLPVLLVAGIYGVAALYQARSARAASLWLPPEVATAASESTAEPTPDTGVTQRGGAPEAWAARLGARWRQLLASIPLSPHLVFPLAAAWLCLASLATVIAMPYNFFGYWSAGDAPAPHQAQIATLLRRIPADATVAATDTLDPHLSERATIYLLPDPLSYQAEYVAADLMSPSDPLRTAELQMFQVMEQSHDYRVVGQVGTVIVLQRVGPPLAGG